MSTSFPLDGLRIRFSGETDVGSKRTHNEDNLHLPVEERLAIVADGMGGHASGEVASEIAVNTLVEYFGDTADDQTLTWPFKVDKDARSDTNRLITAIKLANLRIFDRAAEDSGCKGMGTTLVAALFLDNAMVVGHVGDSRVYLIRDGRITQITEDHSLIQDYIKMKRMTAEEAVDWPHKNVIVRALGMKRNVAVDVYTEAPRLGDTFLLCSDGLSGEIDDATILDITTNETDLDKATEALIAAANDAGGSDNITVVLARVEKGS